MGFAEELVKNRKAANLTQEALAEKCNVSRQAIAKWEKAESLPDVYTIAKLAGLFDISIEDLIWSKSNALIENKTYYVRDIQETDRSAFLKLMREHRWFGGLLKKLDTFETNETDGDLWETYTKKGHTYVVCTKEKQEMIGYFYVESPGTSAPQMSLQFRKNVEIDEYLIEIVKELSNMLNKEFKLRAIEVFINTEFERNIFRALGYENVTEEVMFALPV